MKNTCFVVMGYGSRLDPASGKRFNLDKVYHDIIKPIVVECGYDCCRGDEIPDSGIIDVSMYYGILDSDLVIADLSTLNPNAIYELGVRHGVRKKKTIVMMEHNDSFFFDLNHVRTLQYEYYAKGKAWCNEVEKTKSILRDRILYLEQQEEKDSPLYTFIEDLCEPHKESSPKSVSKGVPLYERVRAAINARRAKQYDKALELFSELNEQYPSDVFFLQQKALCTYKLKAPSEKEAYDNALTILEPIAKSVDPETNGLIASIYKRLYELTQNAKYIDLAIDFLEKAYGVYRSYYNGDNLAFCLNMKAALEGDEETKEEAVVEARKIRKDIITRNKDVVFEEINTEEEIWLLSTLANCYLALGNEAKAQEYEKYFLSKADKDMRSSYLEQKIKLMKLLNICN